MADDNSIPSETVTVEAIVEGEHGSIGVDADVAVSVARSDFYDDGRQLVRAEATVARDGATVTTTLREQSGSTSATTFEALLRPDEPGEYSGDVRILPEDLYEPYRSANLRIVGSDAATVVDAVEAVEGELEVRRDEVQSTAGLSVDADRTWEEGSDETHAIYASGTVSFADGRELSVKWRNAVDVGHQVFVGNNAVDIPDDNTDGFDEAEIDAAVALATEQSPMARGMRMRA